MRVSLMKERPASAGVAKIHFVPPREITTDLGTVQGSIGARRGSDIFLPLSESARFYPLLQGEQFLFTEEFSGGRKLLFGGTDENPFLTELETTTLEAYMEGEKAFFEDLKPKNIQAAEKSYHIRAKRQGDFFALTRKKEWDWKHLPGMYKRHRFELSEVTEDPLSGTRHHFTGILGKVYETSFERDSLVGVFGEGVIEAPDHEPLILKYPHFIQQARRLVRPQHAD